MKRQGNLYQKIADPDNLRFAFHRAMKGKQDRGDVVKYRRNLNRELAALRQVLLTENVRVGEYRFFTVHDPKERRICAASFPERVLHHAIMNICEPFLESFAIDDSYACRKNQGLHKAIHKAQSFSRSYGYYLKLDVFHYFDHIDHAVLRRFLARRFKDQQLLALFDIIIDSYQTDVGKGMPIGNLISQHMANYYLGYLDHFLKENLQVKGYVRYMDDLLVFGGSKRQLKNMFEMIRDYLSTELRLTLKENRQLNRCNRGIPYLGFRIFPSKILLNKRSRNRFIQKYSRYEQYLHKGIWNEEAYCRHMEALFGFVRSGDTLGFRNKVIQGMGF